MKQLAAGAFDHTAQICWYSLYSMCDEKGRKKLAALSVDAFNPHRANRRRQRGIPVAMADLKGAIVKMSGGRVTKLRRNRGQTNGKD